MRISWLKLSHASNEKSLSSEGSPIAPSAWFLWNTLLLQAYKHFIEINSKVTFMFKKVFKIFVTFIISAIVSGENTVTYMIRDSNKLDWSLLLSALVDVIDFSIKSTIWRIKTGLKFNINFSGNIAQKFLWVAFMFPSCLEFQLRAL